MPVRYELRRKKQLMIGVPCPLGLTRTCSREKFKCKNDAVLTLQVKYRNEDRFGDI